MTVNSRNKGASFERAIATELHLLTGITFKRNLEQTRAADHGDLTPDVDAWPFSIECKRYASGQTCRAEWKAQAVKSAAKVGKFPAVVFKYDRHPIRVAVPFSAFAVAFDFGAAGVAGEWAEITLDGLAYLAREIMLAPARVVIGGAE